VANSMITVIAPLAAGSAAGVRNQISTSLGNPANAAVAAALEGTSDQQKFVHFVSLHAITAPDGSSEWLALELSCDGAAEPGLRSLAERLQTVLQPIFSKSSDWKSGDKLADILPLDILHRNIKNTIRLVKIVDRTNVRMIELRAKLSLAFESSEIGCFLSEFGRKDLDDGGSVELGVEGFINGPLSA